MQQDLEGGYGGSSRVAGQRRRGSAGGCRRSRGTSGRRHGGQGFGWRSDPRRRAGRRGVRRTCDRRQGGGGWLRDWVFGVAGNALLLALNEAEEVGVPGAEAEF